MKFKVGDEVVVVRNSYSLFDKSYTGRTFTIHSTLPDGTVVYPVNEMGAYEVDIELKVVVDSPLYKALE